MAYSPASPNSRFGISLILAVGFFVAVVAVLGWRIVDQLNEPGTERIGMMDFRDAAYFPALSLVEGGNPYDGPEFKKKYPAYSRFPPYAPLTVLVHTPYALLPQRTAEVAGFTFNTLLVLVLAALSLRLANRFSIPGVFVVGGLILMSRPGHQNFVLGQLTLPLAIFSTLSLRMANHRPVAGGFLASLALMKPTFGLPILGLQLIRKNFRLVISAIVFTAIINVPILLFIAKGNGGVAKATATLLESASSFQSENPYGNAVLSFSRIDLHSSFARLIGNAGPYWLVYAIMACVIGLTGWVLVRGLLKGESAAGSDERMLGVASFGTLLCVYHQPHELLLLVPFTVWLATSLWEDYRTPRTGSVKSRYPDWAMLVLLIVVHFNYAATSSVLARLGGPDSPLWLPIVSLNGWLLMLAFAILCWRVLRPEKLANE